MTFANWKTSLVGLIEAAALGMIDVAVSGTLTWKGILLGSLAGIRGFLTKDYDTTGTGVGASKAKDVSNIPINANPNSLSH